jgi:RNA polymerase-interacting CarD/CdnL/TRCF family regulator
MLKEDIFVRVAEEYGTSVGIANIFKVQPLEEARGEFDNNREYKEYEEELTINHIICKAIDLGEYQKLQRVLYRMNLKRDKRLKEITLYRRAWKELVNKSIEDYNE